MHNRLPDNRDGQYYINDKRNKTGVFYTAVILEQGVEILKKYHFKLPIIGNSLKTTS